MPVIPGVSPRVRLGQLGEVALGPLSNRHAWFVGEPLQNGQKPVPQGLVGACPLPQCPHGLVNNNPVIVARQHGLHQLKRIGALASSEQLLERVKQLRERPPRRGLVNVFYPGHDAPQRIVHHPRVFGGYALEGTGYPKPNDRVITGIRRDELCEEIGVVADGRYDLDRVPQRVRVATRQEALINTDLRHGEVLPEFSSLALTTTRTGAALEAHPRRRFPRQSRCY